MQFEHQFDALRTRNDDSVLLRAASEREHRLHNSLVWRRRTGLVHDCHYSVLLELRGRTIGYAARASQTEMLNTAITTAVMLVAWARDRPTSNCLEQHDDYLSSEPQMTVSVEWSERRKESRRLVGLQHRDLIIVISRLAVFSSLATTLTASI
jgi:hypothetical protein